MGPTSMMALGVSVRRPLGLVLLLVGCSPASARHGHAVRGLSAAAGGSAGESRALHGPGAAAVAHLAPELHSDSPSAGSQPDAPELVQGKTKGGRSQWSEAFLKAFFVVSVAELFDKTWFMSLILALKLGWKIALSGGYTGLLLHCVLSALLGFGFSKLLKPSVLHFITAGLFFLFTLLYAKDWYYAEPDSDLIASGKEEAAEAMGEEEAQDAAAASENTQEDNSEPAKKEEKQKPAKSGLCNSALVQSFVAVFIAEWGDRTQMAMIGLHSSLPVLPVFVGSALAFFALTVSAIVVASFIARAKLSERLVMGTASLSFLVFAILALLDGLRAKQHGH